MRANNEAADGLDSFSPPAISRFVPQQGGLLPF
jgi:hypothetical protein